MHEERIEFDNGNGDKLVGILTVPNNHAPIVIFAHGLGSSKDSGTYRGLQHGLNALGIGCLRFDIYGHGESDGQFEDITLTEAILDLKHAHSYVHKRYPHARIGIAGSSFGGAACYYSLPELDVHAAALICPALEGQKNWKRRVNAVKIKEWKTKGSFTYTGFSGEKRKLGYGYFEDIGEYTPAMVKTKKPLLFVHGDKDTIISYADSQKASKALGAKLIKIKGADHNFSKGDQKDDMLHYVVDFFVEMFAMDPEHTHGHQM